MAANSKIEWTTHTFNHVWGCRRVSPACDNCYAASLSNRVGSVEWDSGDYRTFGNTHWREPIKWDFKCRNQGIRESIFCASMADVFDVEAPDSERQKLWNIMRQTTNLDWLILTKRPNLALKLLPQDLHGRGDILVGVTAENQVLFHQRGPLLRKVAVPYRFLSIEPLLEPIQIEPRDLEGISWVIVGGETGHGARPMHPSWVRNIRDVCQEAEVAFFFKQWGNLLPWEAHDGGFYWKSQTGRIEVGFPGFVDPPLSKWIIPNPDLAFEKVNKKDAGRMLDGRTWNQFPQREGIEPWR